VSDDNRLLTSLPSDLLSRVRADLEPVSLDKDFTIMERGADFDAVYFPTSCLVSVVANFQSGDAIEAMLVGSEGFAGLPALFGTRTANVNAFVQIPGEAMRLDIEAFWRHLGDARFRDTLGRFVVMTVGRMAQSTGCVAFHPVEQRLARWLLMVEDAIEESEFTLTQEFIGIMLGVHRPTVTIATRTLENAGLIEHSRGRIKILNRQGLEEASCECYRTWAP
jgi:CRP-like cAMP-binding protein